MAKVKPVNVIFNILMIVAAFAVCFVGFNLISGANGYAVVSDSMKDTLNKGDVVFVRAVEFDSLEVGDVVTVKVGDKGYFTHRIVEIDYENDTVLTRGDANPSVDPKETDGEMIVGKMWYKLPFIGYLSIWFSGKSAIKGVIILAVIASVLVAVNAVLAKKNKKNLGKEGDGNEQN